jgi:hypothetical protein
MRAMSTAWTNGTIIRFQSRLAPVDLAATMRETLEKFDAWAIVNLAGEFADSAETAGPISQFFGRPPVKTFSQIYIVSSYKDDQYEKATDGIRSVLKGISSPAFHFLNGKIILVETDEPSSITVRRCRTYLRVGPKSSSTQTKLSEHETNRGEVEKSERVSGEIFEILGQPAAAIKPSESAFDNPTSRQKLEPFCPIGAFDDFDLQMRQDFG